MLWPEFGVEPSLPVIVVFPDTVLAEVRTGKFCRLLGPLSKSPVIVGGDARGVLEAPQEVYAQAAVGEDRVVGDRVSDARGAPDGDPVDCVEGDGVRPLGVGESGGIPDVVVRTADEHAAPVVA